ncbi:MAG: PKD domain-containing protein [Bacteroidetes bacterium]|nr:PKD domain-containing protein [Bacteroidota bacterium]
MKHRFLLLYFVLLMLPLGGFATHIVGGSLTYEQLSGSTYRVTLKLYRDCKPGSAAFPNPVTITIRKNNGTAHTTVNIPFPGASLVPPNIDTCAVNPGICLEEAIYTTVVSGLPPGNGGYHMYYQYCCRNSTLQNIVNPLAAGETWYAHIPENASVISNSSPKWVNPPPVFVCQGNNMSVNHSATDADGDSLAYSLYTPYTDQAITYPGNVFTTPTVTWSSTYGANNPLDPATPNSLTISPSGILNGVPPTIGQFVAGVKCEEWRNGVKIGEILRDFQFNVVNCPPLAVASFNSLGACNGTAITFNNTTSPPANSYFWDFGDGSTLSDTSNLLNPTYNYPSLGNYTATLIINRGTPCADTAILPVNVSYIQANFIHDGPACKGVPINFTDTSNVDPSSTIVGWDWNFGDGNTSTLENPVHPYNAGGTYNVSLIATSAAGCKDTIFFPVSIQGLPIANAGNDTISCTNNPTVGLGGTILNAGGGLWSGGGVFTPNDSTLNATYTPSATAVANGADTLFLISTSNALCPADTDQVIITFYAGPTANSGADILVCKDTVSVPVCATISVASGGVWQTTGSGVFTNPNLLCTNYIPSLADTASGSVILYLTTTGNGNCLAANDSVLVTFTPTPVATITSNDTSCQSNPILLGVNTTTGSGVWTSSGTGTFAPNDTTLNGAYYPSAADDASGNVTLLFTSTNNGGCRATYDTIDVTLIPSPTAVFTSTSACPFVPVVFTEASTSAVGSVVSWNWNFGDGSPISTTQNPTHPYSVGGPYNVSLVVTSTNGCPDTLNQIVNVYYQPNAGYNANGICVSDGTVFTDTSTVTGSTITSWNWNFGDASNSTIQNPTHNYPSSGNYNVTLIVQSAQSCADTITQTIGVLAGPAAAFTVDDAIADVNQPVNFTDLSTNGAVSWFWDFGDSSSDSTSTVQNPTHVYSQGGFYDVCLIVTDTNGCTDTICRTEIVTMPPDVPSGFSPNGDGQNDVFYVYGGPFRTLKFKIYNNWGEVIFESDSQSKGWDGKRDGVDQPVGVYVYTVEGVTEDGLEHKLSGDVTLLR